MHPLATSSQLLYVTAWLYGCVTTEVIVLLVDIGAPVITQATEKGSTDDDMY